MGSRGWGHSIGGDVDASKGIGRALALMLLAGCVSCSDGEKEAEGVRSAVDSLSAEQQTVLGFENPTTHWSSSSGTLSEASGNVTEGSKALAVTPGGWTEVTSVSLDALGPVQSNLSVDLFLPSAANWGEFRAILIVPSLGIHWADLGGKGLSQLAVGQYNTVTFSLPAGVEQALEGSYSDLRIKLILNGPTLGAPYLLDNLVLAETTGSPEPAGPVEFQLVVPKGQSRESMFLSASDYLQVDERVEVNLSGQMTNVAGLGQTGVEFKAAVVGHTNVFGVGNVVLRSQTLVDGFVRTEGIIDGQDATVQVLGASQFGANVPTFTHRWTVEFPESPASLDLIPPTGPDIVLDPGAYQDLNAHGSQILLRTGTYYFDTFNTEPPSRLVVDNAAGPVIIYVKEAFTYKGLIGYESSSAEGQLLVGYLGSSPAFLQGAFVGTLVAPNGQIELRRPMSGQHKGSFFGKRIQVFSDSHILHLPFDWSTFPENVPDCDGDGVPDPSDTCVCDPNKTEPLLCRCYGSEVDTDGDTVPDCLDRCPRDPNKSQPGACGCMNEDNAQPAGKRCIIEECAGSQLEGTCDGAGQCVGSESCDPVPGSCFHIDFGDSVYWFCDEPSSWEQAEEFCNAEPGRSLVKVDDTSENLWLSNVLATGAIGASTWIGGSDLIQSGRWNWSTAAGRDAVLFWSNGFGVREVYENWQAFSPGDQHCAQMVSGGVWTDADCATAQGFVCEQPLRLRPVGPGPLRLCDFIPIPCDGDDDEPPAGPCVEQDVEFPHIVSDPPDEELDRRASFQEMERIAEECTENCQAEGDPGCSTFCVGFASVPPPGECDDFSPTQRELCTLESLAPSPNGVDPPPTCSIQEPTCPAPYMCGRTHECAALDANFEPTPCEDHSDCATGVCGQKVKVCINPAFSSACDVRDGEKCVGLCFGILACGLPHEDCAFNDDTDLLDRCSETLICPDEGTVDLDTNPLSDPASNLEPAVFPKEELFPVPEEPELAYETSKPNGCGDPGEPPCVFDVGPDGVREHPWCKYVVDPAEATEPHPISDADDFGNKQGTGGSSGPIRFDFDPNLSINYQINEPLPFGDSKFFASAEASATASAHFDLFGIGGDIDILDALGRLQMDRCGLVAEARLALFGFDFLPALMGSNYGDIEAVNTPNALRTACAERIDELVAAVSRVKKAMRDAQELIRQQQLLVANGMRYKPDLCQLLLEQGGVPAGFPSENAPFTGCGDLTPEETVNLFIRYYEAEVNELRVEHQRLLLESIPPFPTLSIPFLEDVDNEEAIDHARRETQQIANISFLIGPIPLNLTIEAFVQYGISGAFNFSLTPDALIHAYDSGKRESLAHVDATVTPFAGAGVSMFLGVGFDFGALSAKAGISGDVSLGLVTLPIYAGAGIGVEAEDDARPLPADLQDMVASANVLYPDGPAKKFRVDGYYKFGAHATISNILSGKIFAKLRIKFFFFSKTWSKVIAEFASPFDPIDLTLINGGGSTEFADAHGILGLLRMPIPFVKLEPVEDPGPLPPLPDPDPTTTSTTSTDSGTDGSGTTSTSSGGPQVSLRVLHMAVPEDPRYVDFDPSRVERLFYDGYCACSAEGGPCQSDIDCCGEDSCVFNDLTGTGSCRSCVQQSSYLTGGGEQCLSTSQCCQDDPGELPVSCYPIGSSGGQTYCQTCRGQDEPVSDSNFDGIPDHDECCGDLGVFRGPLSGSPNLASPVCSGCRTDGQSCNTLDDCCDRSSFFKSCEDFKCFYTSVPK